METLTKDIKSYLHLYLGCDTNHGKLVGLKEDRAIVQHADGWITDGDAKVLKPILRRLEDMTEEEAKRLAINYFQAEADRFQLLADSYTKRLKQVELL